MNRINDITLRQTIQDAINKTLLKICKKQDYIKIWYSEDKEEHDKAHWIVRICKEFGARDNPKAKVHEWTKEARKQLKKIGAQNYVTTETANSTVNYLVFDLIDLIVPTKITKRQSKKTNVKEKCTIA